MDFSSQSPAKRRPGAEINVTSLVDIIFNLLLFFMLTTSFSTESGGIEVELPKAGAKAMSLSDQDVLIALTEKGEIIMKNERLSKDELGLALDRLKDRENKPRVIIQADRRVPHGQVVEIMDLAKSRGLNHIALATQGTP